MIQPYPCSNCQGAGCRVCNNVGFFGRDQSHDYYLMRDMAGNVTVAGIKGGGSTGAGAGKVAGAFFGLIGKLLAEPHDFFWAIKQKK